MTRTSITSLEGNRLESNGIPEIPFLSFIPTLDSEITEWAEEGLNHSQYCAPFYDYDALGEGTAVSSTFRLGISDGKLHIFMILNDKTPVGCDEVVEFNPFCDIVYIYFDTSGDQAWTDGNDDVKMIKLSNVVSPELFDGYYSTLQKFDNSDLVQFSANSKYLSATSQWVVEISIPFSDDDTGDFLLEGNETISLTVDYQNAINTGLAQIDNGFNANFAQSTWTEGVDELIDFKILENTTSIIAVRNIVPTGTYENGDEVNITYSIASNSPQLYTDVVVQETLPPEFTSIITTTLDDITIDTTTPNLMEISKTSLRPGDSFSFSTNTTLSVAEDKILTLGKLSFGAFNAFGNAIEIEIGSNDTLVLTIESTSTDTNGDTEEVWYYWIIGSVIIIVLIGAAIFSVRKAKAK